MSPIANMIQINFVTLFRCNWKYINYKQVLFELQLSVILSDKSLAQLFTIAVLAMYIQGPDSI